MTLEAADLVDVRIVAICRANHPKTGNEYGYIVIFACGHRATQVRWWPLTGISIQCPLCYSDSGTNTLN